MAMFPVRATTVPTAGAPVGFASAAPGGALVGLGPCAGEVADALPVGVLPGAAAEPEGEAPGVGVIAGEALPVVSEPAGESDWISERIATL